MQTDDATVKRVPKGVQIAIGALVCAALLGWYGATNLGGEASYRYFDTLEEFLAAGPATRAGERLRIKGYVANGSIERELDARRVRFAIQNDPPHAVGDATERLAVDFASLETPDLFKDGAEVVVEGRVEAGGGTPVFFADNVLAKCPSKFQAKAEGAADEATPL
ncbi:MAG: cytochrome c maturation protein CcmE [Myxococcota bacterium]|nr:cytochrome c maturation protein CcmE [Myxococcales bacterium]